MRTPPWARPVVFIQSGADQGLARILIFGSMARICFRMGMTSALSGSREKWAMSDVGFTGGEVVVGIDLGVHVGGADGEAEIADADAVAGRCEKFWRRVARLVASMCAMSWALPPVRAKPKPSMVW